MKRREQSSSKPRPSAVPRRLDLLQKQHRRLRQEIKQLKAERDQYKKSLIAMMREDVPIRKKELLALVGKKPSLRELIAELQRQGD